jgi:hypothetical protein
VPGSLRKIIKRGKDAIVYLDKRLHLPTFISKESGTDVSSTQPTRFVFRERCYRRL